MKKRKHSERGSATVEAILSLTAFLFTIFTILNVVNYCRVQALVSNAVDSAAKELSEYAYFYKMSGLQKFGQELDAISDQGDKNLNAVIDTVDQFQKTVTKTVDDSVQASTNIANMVDSHDANIAGIQNMIKGLKTDVQDIDTSMGNIIDAFDHIGSDPLTYMRSMIAIAADGALEEAKSHLVAAPLAKLFVSRQFAENMDDASAVLEQLGVKDGLKGMNFNMSTIFNNTANSEFPNGEAENIHLVVYYCIELPSVFKWAELKLPVCKEAIVRAWLGGDNVVATVKKAAPPAAGDDAQGDDDTASGYVVAPEEPEESEQPVDLTNSYWTLEDPLLRVALRSEYSAFLLGYDRVLQGAAMQNGALWMDTDFYYAPAAGNDTGVAGGMSWCTDSSGVDTIYHELILNVMPLMASEQQRYEESNGQEGHSLDNVDIYIYTVYVPENISDEELQALKDGMEDKEFELGLFQNRILGEDSDIDFQVSFVRGGGNYDYSGGASNE